LIGINPVDGKLVFASEYASNGTGIDLTSTSHDNTIGGPNVADRNVIGRNDGAGVQIGEAATNNTVLGNYIGTTVAGDNGGGGAPYGNHDGILIEGPANHVGPGNLIANNARDGVNLEGSSANNNAVDQNQFASQFDGQNLGNHGSAIGMALGPTD